MRTTSKSGSFALAIVCALAVISFVFLPGKLSGANAADEPNTVSTSGFSGVPGSSTGGADLTRSRFTYQTAPGKLIKDYFYVSNVGTEPVSLRAYAADATTSQNGSFDVGVATDTPVDVAAWVKFANGKSMIQTRLKRGQSVLLPFTLTIPDNATPGDHVGGVAVSTISGPDGQIKIERRVVTRLYARVTGDLRPSISISNLSAKYVPAFNPLSGVVLERFTITNSGNVSLKAIATTQVRGIAGVPLAPDVVTQIAEVLPGYSRDVEVQVSGVGQWVYLNPRVSLVPSVDSDALNPGALVTADKEVTVLEFPTTWFILVVILMSIFFLVRARRRHKLRQMKQWLVYTELEARRKANQSQ